MARKINLTEEMNDPFGSSFIKGIDNLSTENLKLDKETRIDLIDKAKDKIEVNMIINRMKDSIFKSDNIDIVSDTDSLMILETRTSQR